MTYHQLGKLVIEKLHIRYDEREAKAIQRYLFNGIKERETIEWLKLNDEEADTDFEEKVLEAIPQLMEYKPVQYIIGKTWFCDLEFEVTPDVLIPRPETEQLVKMIIHHSNKNRDYSVLDVGTGSGAIAISLCKYISVSKVIGIDISKAALKVAINNAAKHCAKVAFLYLDILNLKHIEKEFQGMKFDLIVSNPPYVKKSEVGLMKQNVLDYEPHIALFVSDTNPLLYYNSIINFAADHLINDGVLWFEINENEGMNLIGQLKQKGFASVKIFNDYNDKPRFIKAYR